MSMMTLPQDVEELHTLVPEAPKEACLNALKHLSMPQAVSFLKSLYSAGPVEPLTISPPDEPTKTPQINDDLITDDDKNAMFFQLQEYYPDLDHDMILIFLEDYRYDYATTKAAIDESQRIFRDLVTNSPIEILREKLPDLCDDIYQEALRDSNNDPNVAFEILTQEYRPPPPPQKPVQITQFHQLPMTQHRTSKKQKKKKANRQFQDIFPASPQPPPPLNEEEETAIQLLLDIFPTKSVDELRRVLVDVEFDVSDAAAILSNEEQPIDTLKAMFPGLTDEQFLAALDQCNGNIEEAASAIIDSVLNNPTPETNLIALRPDLSREDVADALNRSNGNEEDAERIIYSIPKRQHQQQQRTQILTYDLHGHNVHRATSVVLSMLRSPTAKTIHFITGRGAHSVNKKPVLRGLVIGLCKQRGFPARIHPINPGVVVVNME